MGRYKSRLDLSQKLMVIEWLKKREDEFSTFSYAQIAKLAETELSLPFTDAVIRELYLATGMKHFRRNSEDGKKRTQEQVIVRSLLSVYSHISCKAPSELVELAEKLGVQNGGQS